MRVTISIVPLWLLAWLLMWLLMTGLWHTLHGYPRQRDCSCPEWDLDFIIIFRMLCNLKLVNCLLDFLHHVLDLWFTLCDRIHGKQIFGEQRITVVAGKWAFEEINKSRSQFVAYFHRIDFKPAIWCRKTWNKRTFAQSALRSQGNLALACNWPILHKDCP